jgi:hypothetical protein
MFEKDTLLHTAQKIYCIKFCYVNRERTLRKTVSILEKKSKSTMKLGLTSIKRSLTELKSFSL